jgi:putative transposase
LNDDQRRRLAVLGRRLGGDMLRTVSMLTPDTILRWHRDLIAQKSTYARQRPGRPAVMVEIRRLVVRMATDNLSWGYPRIQEALKNPSHRVARSTIASILKAEGIPPSRERPTTWRNFLRAHWPALVVADFLTTEVWAVRGLVTYYTVFTIELQSRRVRDRKWSHAVREFPEEEHVRIIQTPFRAPNCNAYAERFVRSIKEECLSRVIPLGEHHLRRTIADFLAHYHGERNHQGGSENLHLN